MFSSSALAEPHAEAAAGCFASLTVAGEYRAVAFDRVGVSCRTARAIGRRYVRAPRSACGGNACAIRWKDGWSCISATLGVMDRTGRYFSCNNGTRQILAHSPA